MKTQQLAKLRSIVPETRRVRHIHLSALVVPVWRYCRVLANQGYQISGSDLAPNPVTKQLTDLGATIYFNHRPENVRDASVVVVSSAISADNPGIVAAHEARIPGDPSCRNAGGVNAFSSWHRHCRNARQNDNHRDGFQHLRRSGARPSFVNGGLVKAAGVHARLGQVGT